jgi:hypothetical protein
MDFRALPELLILLALLVTAVAVLRPHRATPPVPTATANVPATEDAAPAIEGRDLTVGMRLADGTRVTAVVIDEPEGVDRSAGRHCRVCGRHGTHHTDTHDEFMTVQVLVIEADGSTGPRTFALDEQVALATPVLTT